MARIPHASTQPQLSQSPVRWYPVGACGPHAAALPHRAPRGMHRLGHTMKPPVLVHPTGDAVVTATYQRPPVFNRPPRRRAGVLPLLMTVTKPAVIRQVQQKIHLRRSRPPRQLGHHVSKQMITEVLAFPISNTTSPAPPKIPHRRCFLRNGNCSGNGTYSPNITRWRLA